jgi:hypothetical protein
MVLLCELCSENGGRVLHTYLVHSTYGIFVPEATKDRKIVKPAVPEWVFFWLNYCRKSYTLPKPLRCDFIAFLDRSVAARSNSTVKLDLAAM